MRKFLFATIICLFPLAAVAQDPLAFRLPESEWKCYDDTWLEAFLNGASRETCETLQESLRNQRIRDFERHMMQEWINRVNRSRKRL